jgi:hypothetical protein
MLHPIALMDKVPKQVLDLTSGRWASLYDMVERIAPRDQIIEAIRTINNDEEYQVRKRDPNDTEDAMLREYRTYHFGCGGCANRIGNFHKATCAHAGTLVVKAHCKEW